ncbi:MAG: GTP 3',8-cyclase MoaA, partial [Legionellales bacterium]|nr:GTP 3',8-cyclase MoaA [Legionellales bacterium]
MNEANTLIDNFNRHINYVRISVTDRCDFRCVYCMSEKMKFVPRAQLLTLEEITTIADVFTQLGVKKIRITGGEPLVRQNIITLFENLGNLSELEELTTTTNGSQLIKLAEPLKKAGVSRINISLDSLNTKRFENITRTGKLDNVLKGIDKAISVGFKKLKINSVILKNRNHDEIIDLVSFAIKKNMDISFIEEMPLGIIDDHDRNELYYSSDEIKNDIQ